MEGIFGGRCGLVCFVCALVFACVIEYNTKWLRYKILSNQNSLDAYADTECGRVVGNETTDGYIFAGIPFAQPPEGKLRWKAPITLDPDKGTCWKGTYNAKQFGDVCYQRDLYNASVHIGSEDCLFLSVWTPTLNTSAQLPVMVWIHGGFLWFGSGDWPKYSPTSRLAKDTQMVYVGINYRLGALGFMSLDLLSKDSETGTSGNYGLMDQIAALQWIKDNIKNFGGDPNSVTLYGQSSGGTAIFALLVSPKAANLFHRAWMISGSPIFNTTLAEASKDNLVFQCNTGCSSVSCLYNLTAAEVTDATPWDEYPNWAMTHYSYLPTKGLYSGALLVVDGIIVPEAPYDAWKNGRGIDVPLLIGSTAQETDMLLLCCTDIDRWRWDDYMMYVTKKMEPFGQSVLDGVFKYYPMGIVSPEYQLTSLIADIRVNCLTDDIAARAQAKFTKPVYRYIADYFPSMPVHVLGIPFPAKYAFHMIDLYGFMGMDLVIEQPSDKDIIYQQLVQIEIVHFCKTGEVKSSSWKPFPKTTAIIRDYLHIIDDVYHRAQCDFLSKTELLSYSWLN